MIATLSPDHRLGLNINQGESLDGNIKYLR